jgi:hypothetical protein
MEQIKKQNIVNHLQAYCERYESQKRAANSLKGVSAATVSQMLSGKWELIADVKHKATLIIPLVNSDVSLMTSRPSSHVNVDTVDRNMTHQCLETEVILLVNCTKLDSERCRFVVIENTLGV